MNEININIEGYNVNGICVGCLNYNRKMFYSDNIKDCFKLLANIDVPDGLTIQVCWECLSAVRHVEAFQKQILNSYDVLIKYSKEHTFLNSPSDLTKHATQRFSKTPVNLEVFSVEVQEPVVEFESAKIDDIEIKNEVEIEFENNFEEPKEEAPSVDDDVEFPEVPVTYESQSSDDDIQLSELKYKEEKKEKKSKKDKKKDRKRKSHKETNNTSPLKRDQRKLKNLSEDIVRLHIMSDEEMLRVRSEDIASKEFRKLKYKCEDCVLTFNTQKLMIDHMNGKHKKKGPDCHQCDVCKAYFLTRDNLSTHRSLHSTAYSCVQCDFKTTLKRVMLKHCRVHNANSAEYKTCNTCGSVFSSKSKLSYHKGICHQEKPQCDCCGKVFANKMTLKYHLKILPLNKEEKPKEKLFLPCKGCDKIFHSRKSYRAHVVIHDGLTYPCQICGKLFQWKRNLARHMRNHREKDAGALHECRECGKSFSSRDCYNNHMRLSKKHVDEDAYVHECNYCGKKFATKWCMVDHIDWDHLKTIKYQCSFCFKAFKTAKIMVAHVNNLHQGKKKEPEGEHLCEICGKSYKTVKRLKGHVWAMHTNRSTAKSFKCKLCPATFTWQTSIYKHMKMMHDNKKKPTRYREAPPHNKKQEAYTEQANRAQSFQQNLSTVPQNIVNNLVPNIVTNIVTNAFVLGV